MSLERRSRPDPGPRGSAGGRDTGATLSAPFRPGFAAPVGDEVAGEKGWPERGALPDGLRVAPGLRSDGSMTGGGMTGGDIAGGGMTGGGMTGVRDEVPRTLSGWDSPDGARAGAGPGNGQDHGRGVTALVLAVGLGIGILLVAAIVLLQGIVVTLPVLVAVLIGILAGPPLAGYFALRLMRALARGEEADRAAAGRAAAFRDSAAAAAGAAPLPIAVTGLDGRVLFANRAMREMAAMRRGDSLPEALGLPLAGTEAEPDEGGDVPDLAGWPEAGCLRLPAGDAARWRCSRLPDPEGRLFWHLQPVPPADGQVALDRLLAQVGALDPSAELRLLREAPGPAGPLAGEAEASGEPPVLWRQLQSKSGLPARPVVGLRLAAGLPPLWLEVDSRNGEGAMQDDATTLPQGLSDLPVGVALVDADGRLRATNTAFEALAGRPASPGAAAAVPQTFAEPVPETFAATVPGSAAGAMPTCTAGMPLGDLLVEADRQALAQLLRPSAVSAPPAGGEPATLHFAGSPDRSIHLIAGPEAGDRPRLVLALDVTAQKGVEQQFAHGQKMQAIGQLAGGVAHDFNNLLTAMIGFCDLLLQRHPPTDQSFADVQQIKQNALRAAGLVRQLLAFSRRQTLRPRPLDVGDVLADLRHLISRLIGERIRLTIVHGRNLGIVRVDRGQLEQVIINLAVNARDAMRDGGTLSITTSAEEIAAPLDRGSDRIPPGRYVRIDVADAGTGVPPEHADKIFDPFFTTKKQGEGTGLGLSTVYGIIRQTGGFVFLGRNGPDGATFSILLPEASPEARDLTDAPETGTERPPAPRDLTGRETLLLVEDEDAVRLFAARSLRNKGYTVMEAASGEAALELSRAFAGPIHALVTDVVMPNMDGPTLAQEVLRQRPGLAVVFMSGYAEDAVRQTISGGELPSTFLQKPFTLNDLAVTVRSALTGAESANWPSKS